MKWIYRILYYILFALWYIFSLLPLWAHYMLSDFICFILYRVVKYRREVVRKNLISSFPDKSEEDIVLIEREFYVFFCDYIVETVKFATISKKNMYKRMKFTNVEIIQEMIDQGKSCSLYLGHYCNWEWVSSLAAHLHGVHCGQIYHALENPLFNHLFLKIRSRFGGVNIEMNETLRIIGEWHRKGEAHLVGYIADQSPNYESMHYWTNFLNHDTSIFTGAERISRMMDTAVFYLELSRPKRGYYEGRFIKIADAANELPKFEITERYARLLEQNINEYSPYWLWSHNRWKRGREDFNHKFTAEERRRMMNKL